MSRSDTSTPELHSGSSKSYHPEIRLTPGLVVIGILAVLVGIGSGLVMSFVSLAR